MPLLTPACGSLHLAVNTRDWTFTSKISAMLGTQHEATASLDVENESAVQEALSRLLAGKTVLVIAHRMRTVEAADKIVVLSEGRVTEQGTPSELMKQNGIFRHMVELQRQSAGWRLK